MNKDKAIQLLERLQDPEPYEPKLTKDAYDAIQMAIDALSADGDTISREAAVEALDDAEDAFGYLTRDWREVLMELPSIQLKRSKWVLVCDNNGMHFVCDKCGAWRYHQKQNFCGECGADMRGEQDE